MTLSALGIFSAAGAGGAPAGPVAYDLISTTILGSTTSSVTFDTSTLGSTYKHLQIRYTSRSTDDSGTLLATFNGITGTSYASHRLIGDGSTVASNNFTARANTYFGANGSSNNTANIFAAGVTDILDFASTTKNTTIRSLTGNRGATALYVALISGFLNNTAAITSVTIFGNTGNLIAGSRFSLYGIKG